jgi:hypothetical protein
MQRQLIIVIYVLIQIFLVCMISGCTNQTSINNLENAEEDNKLNVVTNKLIYEYGEPVEITVSLGDISAVDEAYLKLGKCRCRINRDNYKDVFWYRDQRNQQITDECKKYSESFSFDLKKFQTKALIWDQRSCELKNYPSPALPGDYEVSVDCPTGLGGIRESAYFKINEPQSCKDKRVEVIEASWDSSNNIHLKIKNTGTLDVEAVQVLLDICEKTFPPNNYLGQTYILDLNRIKAGEIKEYTIPSELSECYYHVVSARVYGCSNGNPDHWSEIVQPH